MANKYVHFMGILGSGASAAAAIAQAQGFAVSGCDTSTYSEYGHELKKKNILVEPEHSRAHIRDADLLVVSPAILQFDPSNDEILAAKSQKIPVITWQQFSGEYLQKSKFVIAIAGTHGKSTTTAMTAQIMEAAGLDPTVQLGAIVPKWNSNFRVGKSKYFVIEADEYNHNFLWYHPNILAITNIEFDHPEFFADEKAVIAAFQKLCKQVDHAGFIVGGAGVAEKLGKQFGIVTAERREVPLHIPGEFNMSNASLAMAVCDELGILESTMTRMLNRFTAIGRRFSFVGEVHDIRIYDDYGHHPTAVLETAKAARTMFPKQKIYLVFQPHMFTRTKALFPKFVQAFQEAPVDEIIIADIFASREHDTGVVSSKDLVDAIDRSHVRYGGDLKQCETWLLQHLAAGNVVINMGAGDIINLSQWLKRDLENRHG